MSFLQQVEIFSKTKTLVSLHGAALTNMLFMPDDVKIVEIFDLNYMNYCFTSMSASLGFEYRFQVYKDLIDIPEVVKLL
jgi:capsular polysaccharide biosynthesis protein